MYVIDASAEYHSFQITHTHRFSKNRIAKAMRLAKSYSHSSKIRTTLMEWFRAPSTIFSLRLLTKPAELCWTRISEKPSSLMRSASRPTSIHQHIILCTVRQVLALCRYTMTLDAVRLACCLPAKRISGQTLKTSVTKLFKVLDASEADLLVPVGLIRRVKHRGQILDFD